MNMDTIVILVTLIAMLFTILTFMNNQSKKIDGLYSKITNLEIEVKTGFQKIDSKLDVFDGRINTTSVRLDDTNQRVTENKESIKEIKIEFKEQRTEQKNFENKVFDILNASKIPAH